MIVSDIKINEKQHTGLIIGLGALALMLSFITVHLPWLVSAGVLVFGVVATFVLRVPFVGILFIAFFLPFERIGAYEWSGATIRITQVMLIITSLAWFTRQIIIGRLHSVRNPLLGILAVFIAINLMGLPQSLNFSRSIMVLAYIVFTACLAWLVPNIVTQPFQVRRVIQALLVGFIVVTVFGIFQFLGDMTGLPTAVTGLRGLYTKGILGFTRVQSTAYEPLYFANYLLLPLGIIFALFLSGKKALRTSWLIMLFVLGMVNLILTVSRGGYVAVVVTLVLVGLLYLRRLLTLHNIIIFLVGIFLVGWGVNAALGAGDGLLVKERFQEQISNVFYGASYNERINTFEQAFVAWRDSPWIGIGPGAFGPFVSPHPSYQPKDGWRIVNNEYIEILAENGLVGLLVFLLFIAFLILRSLKAIKQTTDHYLRAVMVGLLGAFLGVLAQYMTFSTLYIIHIWFLVGFMIAVQNIIFSRDFVLDNHHKSTKVKL